MLDKEFLMWIADRLVLQHGDRPEVDFIGKLVSIAYATPDNQETPNTRNYPAAEPTVTERESDRMSEPYLIAHSVRGQPAFDVAERLGDDGWIIPTSGHRAMPFWAIRLAEAVGGTNTMDFLSQMPKGWPDHYSCNDRPVRTETGKLGITDLLKDIGI